MYGTYSTKSSSSLASLFSSSTSGWVSFAAVVAVIGGIVLFFTYLNKKNETKYTGFWGWMYDFLTFKKMVIENILRIFYLISAIFITLSSFALISVNVWAFLLYLVVGNIVTRLIYELSLVVLILCRNTTEINKKLSSKKENETPEKTETTENTIEQ